MIRALLHGAVVCSQLTAFGVAGTFASDAYDRVEPSVLAAVVPVVFVGGLVVALALAVLAAREAPRGRRGR